MMRRIIRSAIVLLCAGSFIFFSSCVSKDIFSKSNAETGRYSARLVSFVDNDPALSILSGTVSVVNALDESRVESYRLYWGAGPATKLGGLIDEEWATGAPVNFTLTNRAIPPGATHLLVYSYNVAEGELDIPAACTIVDYSAAGIYVDVALGVDAVGNGTRNNPLATIQYGITRAIAEGYTAVHVAEGTYLIDGDTDPVVLSDGISLYGGYQSVTWTRNLNLYDTILEDISSTGGTVVGNPNRCITAGPGVTNITIVNGFIINGNTPGGRQYTSGINCLNGGSPFIVNCVINGGIATTRSSGIFINNGSAPLIRSCDINGGNGVSSRGIHSDTADPVIAWNYINSGNGDNSAALYNINSTSEITGNIITTGNGTATVYGIYETTNNDSIIRNNTIEGGMIVSATGSAMGIRLENVTSSVIANNTIYGGRLQNSYGIYTNNAATLHIFNNRFDGGEGSGQSFGIYLVAATPNTFICNNVILGGTAPTSRGIFSMSGSNGVKILNNTILGGSAVSNIGFCILMTTSSAFYIVNNIFCTEGLVNRCAVFEGDAGSTPNYIDNNNFFNCPVLYHDSANGDLFAGSIALLQSFSGAGSAVGNVEVPLTLDANLRLVSVFPPAVTQGGDNLFALWPADFPCVSAIPIDHDGTIRTVPWSMGAYEY